MERQRAHPNPEDVVVGGERPRTHAPAARRRRADVAVVGAGLSGLAAACALRRSGASVVVLEARPRVGGRLETVSLLGAAADTGGTWIGAAHARMHALVEELGLTTFPTHDAGARIAIRERPARLGAAGRRLTERSVRRAGEQLEHGEPEAGGTLAEWLDQAAGSRHARTVLRDMLVNVLAADPADVSVAHARAYLRANGGLTHLVGTRGGAQQELVAGGAGQIAERLAARLGGAVELGAPARRIEARGSGVQIAADGVEVDASAAVLALSPALASRVDRAGFELPPVPPPGDAVKCVVAYEEPFWRAHGRSGGAWGDALPFSFTHDVSPPGDGPGILAVFFVGPDARGLRTVRPERREPHIREALVRAFGPRAADAVGIVVRDWTADPWSLGGYGAVGSGGESGDAAVAGGRIVLAGTEAAGAHRGYMEGAVLAGERAAVAALQLA